MIINGRTEKRVGEALKKIGGGSKVRGVAADLATAKGVAEFVKQVPAADILINSLGIFEPKPFAEIPDEDWFRFFETNVMSGVRLSRAYLPGNYFHLERVGNPDPGGNDPLRHDQDGADRGCARSG